MEQQVLYPMMIVNIAFQTWDELFLEPSSLVLISGHFHNLHEIDVTVQLLTFLGIRSAYGLNTSKYSLVWLSRYGRELWRKFDVGKYELRTSQSCTS